MPGPRGAAGARPFGACIMCVCGLYGYASLNYDYYRIPQLKATHTETLDLQQMRSRPERNDGRTAAATAVYYIYTRICTIYM